MTQHRQTLKGKSALITGSISGLGYAMARSLAQQGADIVLHGLEPTETAKQSQQSLAAETGVDVMLSQADLTRVDELEAMMQQAESKYGRVDIVINNAVVRHFAPTEKFTTEQWDAAIAVNLSAAFHTARLAIPKMREAGWGRIINVSSVYGLSATVDRIGYITTKTALIGMTRAIALETASSGITCNAICPGTVPTGPIVERIANIARETGVSEEQARHDYLAARQPTGRFVAMESVAALIQLLCSDAGADMTGSVLPIDGGWTAR